VRTRSRRKGRWLLGPGHCRGRKPPVSGPRCRYVALVTDLATRARTLLDLHRAPELLVLANVWDVVSARVVAGTPGVRALATASHAIAATFGYEDGEQIPLDLHLDLVGRIVSAVDLPVSMDLEAGYGDPGQTTRRAIAIGVVGGNLEDQMRPLDDAVAAVEAVLRAGRDAGIDFVLNARTDAFLLAEPGADRGALLAEAVRRGRAYLAASAQVVFVPGVVAREEIAGLVDGLGRGRVSLMSVPGASPSGRELTELGVARVSTGPNTQRVALTALQDAVVELVAGGTLPAGTRSLT
jgi:2-methylisocitrate lyase-like PEP mutase family enzyme